MTDPKTTWTVSPAGGTMLAKLVELYARALRVDVARKTQRMDKLARMLEKRNRR